MSAAATDMLPERKASAELQQLASRAAAYAEGGRADATKKAYASDFAHFQQWCVDHGVDSLPATEGTVARYLAHLADEDFAASTIHRRIVSISQVHQQEGFASPTKTDQVRSVWRGIRRALGTSVKGKEPLLTEDIKAIVEQLDDESVIDVRDKAIILLGFAGAFRRSELVSINVEDLEFREEGLVVHLESSKTDQDGEGRQVPIPHGQDQKTCPVNSTWNWLQLADDDGEGPLFRSVTRGGRIKDNRISGRTVNRVVKKRVGGIGLDPTEFGSHSLRAGFATEAAKRGVPEREIMRQTGHSSRETVRRYIRDGNLFRTTAAASLGL